MFAFITFLILIAAVLLILIVLVQNSKGGGLAAGFSSSNQIMGVRKTTDFLDKATWGLAGALIFLCIITPRFIPRQASNVQQSSEMQQQINDAVMLDPNLISPDFGTAQPDVFPIEE